MPTNNVLTYADVLGEIGGRAHLLLGNGFSIACHLIFKYQNLYEFAKENGLSLHVQKIFDHFGTNNFEGILHALEDANWVAAHYGLKNNAEDAPRIKSDIKSIKDALVAAVAKTHLHDPGEIAEDRKALCVEFVKPYHNVFTTNYDLLLYWVEMHGHGELQKRDGFRTSPDDREAEYLVFREHVKNNKGMFFLHGALHLYVEDGEVRKHSWIRSEKPLIDLVLQGLESGQYPLFVAEGKARKKLEQIHKNDYLSYCISKLSRIEKQLVIYGHSLGSSDQHILDTIADNVDLDTVYVGLHSAFDDPSSRAKRRSTDLMAKRRLRVSRGGSQLNVKYYDSKTVTVWDGVQ